MEIFIQTLTGSRNKIQLSVDGYDTIGTVKTKIQNMQRIAVDRQRLYLAGKHLEDGLPLAKCDVRDGCTLVLVHNLIDRFDSTPSQFLQSASRQPSAVRGRHRATTDESQSSSEQSSDEGLAEHSMTEREKGKVHPTAGIDVMRLNKVIRDADAQVAQLAAEQRENLQADRLRRIPEGVVAEELTRCKMESRANLMVLSQLVEELKGELVAVRGEFEARDSERKKEIAVLKEEKMKCMNERDGLRERLDFEMQKTLCLICFVKPRDSIIFPCCHLHYCFQCLQQHQDRQTNCPTCRTSISSVLKCNVSIA